MSDTENLISHYGSANLERIREFEEQYIALMVRPEQDTFMMYYYIMNHLSKEGKKKLNLWKKQFMADKLVSGNLLLKVLVRESHINKNATTA